MNPYAPYEGPAETLDETIARRAHLAPATSSNATPLLLSATMQNIEAAALLGAVRLAYGLGPFDSTITLTVEDESEAA